MDGLGIGEDRDLRVVRQLDAEALQRGGFRVGDQELAERVVGPGACDQLRAEHRTAAVDLVELPPQPLRIDEPFLDQKLPHRSLSRT